MNAPTCPRCSTPGADLLATSPVPDVWTVHRCTLCLFVWRSTEPATVVDPDRYPRRFRVTADDVRRASDVPPVATRA